ncbi:MAG: Hsp20/alpha crystallin family protein [Erysipelotrichaceae bacterium]|nr:Hsp20/alpha crystallin family protein [Erysipelotrichaceae bacterium]MCI9311880.1 Hsp20/alpha crystallin family protein [Erysipelotrichaceae bacterium]
MRFFPRTTTDLIEDAFDDMFNFSFFGRGSSLPMSTDIMERDGNYLLDIELPGCKKEDIKMELDNGYLIIHATRNGAREQKDGKGNVLRQERVSGNFQRSFYVGTLVKEQDIKASFMNGELKVIVPKKEAPLPPKKWIPIK